MVPSETNNQQGVSVMRRFVRYNKCMSKKIVVICGHPDSDTFTGNVLGHYQQAAEEAGHEVRRFNLGDMHFDPILHKGYKEIQELEPDLVELQNAIRECDHLVVGYPNWWCTMPVSV